MHGSRKDNDKDAGGDVRNGFSIRPVPVLVARSEQAPPRVIIALEITLQHDISVKDLRERLINRLPNRILVSTDQPGKALLLPRTAVISKRLIRLAELGKAVRPVPYAHLYHALKFLWPKKRFEGVLEPTFQDFWTEYTESLKAGETWRARWFCVRFPWDLGKTMGLDIIIRSARSLFAR